jgi:hypothetical protein
LQRQRLALSNAVKKRAKLWHFAINSPALNRNSQKLFMTFSAKAEPKGNAKAQQVCERPEFFALRRLGGAVAKHFQDGQERRG